MLFWDRKGKGIFCGKIHFVKASINKNRLRVIIAVLVIGMSILCAGYFYYELRNDNALLRGEVKNLVAFSDTLKTEKARVEANNADLAEALQKERGTNNDLSQNLQSEQTRNNAFQSQIQDIAGTVGTLKKLSETDKELLKKYSKVYFLSENYVPAKLAPIDSQYLLNTTKVQQFHGDALPFLVRMLSEASSSGVTLKIASAYRSFSDQAAVKTGYKILYGSGANSFSADQGYSEHQLGTTVDVTTPKLDTLSLGFAKLAEYKWLTENAYRFGFVLSYPQSNAYYQFEPWHWRFVGVALATKLHNDQKYFYDLTQRDIDAYLISIFD